MSDLLAQLARRTEASEPALRPRPLTRFEDEEGSADPVGVSPVAPASVPVEVALLPEEPVETAPPHEGNERPRTRTTPPQSYPELRHEASPEAPTPPRPSRGEPIPLAAPRPLDLVPRPFRRPSPAQEPVAAEEAPPSTQPQADDAPAPSASRSRVRRLAPSVPEPAAAPPSAEQPTRTPAPPPGTPPRADPTPSASPVVARPEPTERLQPSLQPALHRPSAAPPLFALAPPEAETAGLAPRLERPASPAESPSAIVPSSPKPLRSPPEKGPGDGPRPVDARTEPPAVGEPIEPVVHVTIGRVEVRAQGGGRPAPPSRSHPALSLDEYLRRRTEGSA